MSLRHKNIIDLYSAFVEGKELIMIMELAEGGELLKYVSDRGQLKETDARKILLQIVDAICCCHMHGIVHRDLKLENVLFKDTEDQYVKVIDFGISGVCSTFKSDKVDAGTVAYMPPECFESEPAMSAPSLDVWAIGLMFYAMLFGTLPFNASTDQEIQKKIKAAKITFPKNVPVTEKAKELLLMMLQKDPTERLELIQMMDMEYYKLDDQDFQKIVDETEAKFKSQQAAVEENKNEKQELVNDFEEKLNIPGKNGQELLRKASPKAEGKKTVGKKPSSKASKGDPTVAKTFYKNKKTTK